ncbi:MAG TPA: MaoC/PaaZ C-terminal domain-containing protein [Hydrogenophaga sp.]|uniref:MaoC/PaaZ C-terminal domain-containing protein n=1 Tax=Hydrogenophaga sp. TaxID=1904254 RepID=UPI002B928D67|nr:MaoC/PaaZ C-terminal domain-containing protein [Hydrogenophaga sp.]HMN92958.1 MaoC/PaaZ C-terminal domain-containing protein [Hydrogenophaga sp.]HMP09738.1 MaoC/PaaZ C-terminal domain-containing protein [Hydrogenophaga sp.]
MQQWLENRTFEELRIGDKASLVRTLDQQDILAFAAVSGDMNPAHLDAAYAEGTVFHGIIAHGMWGGALISAVLGTRLPGPGTIYLEQQLRFVRPVHPGDHLTVEVQVLAKDDRHRHVELDCRVSNQLAQPVILGMARVVAPATKIRVPMPRVPALMPVDNPQPA